jgi:hypothetical protein
MEQSQRGGARTSRAARAPLLRPPERPKAPRFQPTAGQKKPQRVKKTRSYRHSRVLAGLGTGHSQGAGSRPRGRGLKPTPPGPFSTKPPLFFLSAPSAFLSYTLRHYCASARARGRSRAYCPAPPPHFMREDPKIDRARAKPGAGSHADSTLWRARAHGSCEWAGRALGPGEAPGAEQSAGEVRCRVGRL